MCGVELLEDRLELARGGPNQRVSETFVRMAAALRAGIPKRLAWTGQYGLCRVAESG